MSARWRFRVPRNGQRNMQHNSNVTFSQQQLDYLRGIFPAVVLGPQSSHQHMAYHFGQQSVLQAVEKKTRDRSNNDIPAPR